MWQAELAEPWTPDGQGNKVGELPDPDPAFCGFSMRGRAYMGLGSPRCFVRRALGKGLGESMSGRHLGDRRSHVMARSQ